MRTMFVLGETALSDVRVAIHGVNALTLDRPLLLLPGEEVGKADHPAKVEADAVVMDRLHFHHQDPDILAEDKGLPDLLAARGGAFYRGTFWWSSRIPWHSC